MIEELKSKSPPPRMANSINIILFPQNGGLRESFFMGVILLSENKQTCERKEVFAELYGNLDK